MSDKQLHNQLDNLFADLEEINELPSPVSDVHRAGWTFSCDANGLYQECSPEIAGILGYSPGDLIGEPLTTFGLTPESRKLMQESLLNGESPQELQVRFSSDQGDLITVNLHLFQTPAQNGTSRGWHGFVQVVTTEEVRQPPEPLPATPLEDPGPHPGPPEAEAPAETPPAPPETALSPAAIPETEEVDLQEDLGPGTAAPKESSAAVPAQEPPGAAPDSIVHEPLPESPAVKDKLPDPQPPVRRPFLPGTGALRMGPAVAQPATSKKPAILSVPIRLQEKTDGILEIIDETPSRAWTEDERRLVEEIADQLSLALENAQLFAQTQKALDETESQAQRLALLNEMSEDLSRAGSLQEVFAVTAERIDAIIPAQHVSLAVFDQDRERQFEFIALTHNEDQVRTGVRLPLEGSAVELAVRDRTLVQNPSNHAELFPGMRSVMVAPMLASGRVLGTINLGQEKIGAYTRRDENLLLQVASLLAASMESRRLFSQTEAALAETEALFKAGAELNAVDTYDDILDILRRYTILGEQAHHVTITLYDRPWEGEDVPEWQIPVAQWSAQAESILSRRLPLHAWTNLVRLLRHDAPTVIEDVRNDPTLEPEDIAAFVELADAQSALFTPLNVGGQWIGHLMASYHHQHRFPEYKIRRLMSLAGQAAVAIENIRLFEETRQRARQLQTAAEIARDASETLAVDELLNRAVKLISDRFNFYHVSVYLLDEAGRHAIVRASTGQSGEEMKRRTHRLPVGSKSVIGYVTQTGPLVLNDVSQNPLHQPNPLLPDTRAELGIPLKVGDRIIGALDVQSAEVDPFRADDVAVLQTLADQIAVAVDNARSYELAQAAFQEARQRLQELSMLYSVSQSFSSAPLETEEIANIIARQFVKVLGVPECSVSTLGPDGRSLTTLVDIHVDEELEYLDLEKVGRRYSLADYPAIARALQTMQPEVVDLTVEDANLAKIARRQEENYSQLVIVPMAAKGQPIGVIELKSEQTRPLSTTDELNLVMTLANQAAVALENATLLEEQRHTAERLREVDVLKSQFLANMSHELRTPLNSIIGFSRVILKGIDGPVTELQQQDLTAIYNAGQHLLGLINDILDLSKIEAGKMELSFEPVNLVDLINSVMSTAVGLVKHKPIQLSRQVPENLPSIQADPLRVRQILLNLLSNAAKFTEEGTITVSARAEARADQLEEVVVSVTDSGPGIDVEDQERLFQPFSQVDASPTRKSGGTGLGLSISRHLVEMHGGRIWIDSQPEEGSTFSFAIPTADEEPTSPGNWAMPSFQPPADFDFTEVVETSPATEAAESIAPLEIAPEPIPESRDVPWVGEVLCIDRDPKVTALYQRYLDSEGLRVIAIQDASQALDMARTHQPLAITLDVMLPGVDGWQVLEGLKADPQTASIPVLVCSILDDPQKAQALGAAGSLVKPILEDDLKQALLEAGDSTIQAAGPQADSPETPVELLIVDSDPQDIRLLQVLLKESGGYHTSVATSGRQALETLLSSDFGGVLLNPDLTDMDPLTFMKTLRTNPKMRELPVVVLTGDAVGESVLDQLSRNSQAIFKKSQLSRQAFLESLQRLITR